MTATEQAREALSDAWAAFERATDASQHTDDERASARREAFEALARADSLLEGPEVPDGLSERINGALQKVLAAQADERGRWAELYAAAGRAMQAAERGDLRACVQWLYVACDAEHDLLGDCDRFAEAIAQVDPEGEHDPARPQPDRES